MRLLALFAPLALALAQDAALRVRLVHGFGNLGPFRSGYDIWAVRTDCRQSYHALTIAGGAATLSIPPGEYSVYASGGDMIVKPVPAKAAPGEDLYLELTALAAGEDTAGKPLVRPWRVVVIDQERKPVEGAQVEMMMRGRRTPSGFLQVFKTDAQGEVNLCGERGEIAEITATRDGFRKAKRVVRYEEASGPIEIPIKRQAPSK